MTADFDEDRELCPDGSCIGLIGDDGRCRVCGLTSDGQAPEPVAVTASSPRGVPGDSDGAFDDDRELCPDGACIGILGSDGKCKVCGRSAGS